MAYIFPLLLLALLIARPAAAFCPVCAVAAGAGLEIARILGVDDSIVGLWVGGLTVALVGWTINWFGGKKWSFRGLAPLTIVAYYGLTLVPMYYLKMLGEPVVDFYGWPLSKFVLAILPGSLAFWTAEEWYLWLKKRNGGRAHFPFEKIALPVGTLLVLSFVFYLLTK